ncbi:phosphorylase Pnp/Udp family protein [Streptococcus dysgalactiae subsp. equisimilis]|uniref:Phosphorylase Pnp/Udp family protein n=1 Tax=Streptococcus dysgalactiae subsp. equisimilis TaxID=119602 RepID=A0A9X8T3K9_STREQ|nr:phosphorylase Pnp/Udp family protein [Streptococcus dysgalactiae subsp. equisimilis]
MPITKHEIPLLEFDSDPSVVIMPTHEGLDIQLPPKCVYAFLEDEIEAFALDHQGKKSQNSFQLLRFTLFIC